MKKQKNASLNKEENGVKGDWKKVSPEKLELFRKAFKNTFGYPAPQRGRPAKDSDDKYKPISIRLHPTILEWAKREAKKRGVGYQTIINEVLLKAAA